MNCRGGSGAGIGAVPGAPLVGESEFDIAGHSDFTVKTWPGLGHGFAPPVETATVTAVLVPLLLAGAGGGALDAFELMMQKLSPIFQFN